MTDRPAYAQLRKMVRMATADSWTSPAIVDERTQKLYDQLLAEAAGIRDTARTGAGQPAECTCGDAGACFVPAGHYRDCPHHAPAAEQPTEAHPPREQWRVELWDIDGWMPCGMAHQDRQTAATKHARLQSARPDLTFRFVRETTTWTTEETR